MNPFEIENSSDDDKSSQYSVELDYHLSIALALLLYHIGFMTFEYGASRKKSAGMALFRYPLILIVSILFTWTIGFGVAHGDSHMLGVKYYFLAGVFDYKMVLEDHPEGVVANSANDFAEITDRDHAFSIQIPGNEKRAVFSRREDLCLDFLLLALTSSAVSCTAVSALNERQNIWAQVVISAFISTLIVPLVIGWTFGKGFLAKLYMNDEAGCLCIHFVAGISAFIGTQIISERIGRFNQDFMNRNVEN